ncbi:hypothetical protein ACU686_12905 [Yinghuangia aomiensis]
MAPVALELTRRPATEDGPADTMPNLGQAVAEEVPAPLGPNGIEIVGETDNLLVMCTCSSSSDQPYQ